MKQSKLDEILRSYGGEVADQFGGDTERHPISTVHIEQAKTEMKELILEIIGKDEPIHGTSAPLKVIQKRIIRNSVKEYQRKQVQAL